MSDSHILAWYHMTHRVLVDTRLKNGKKSKLSYRSLATDIYDLCICYDIELCPQWIPKEDNFTMDEIKSFTTQTTREFIIQHLFYSKAIWKNH